jgi:hypothetical protein
VDPFQTTFFSENVVGPGIEAGTSGSVARNSDHVVNYIIKIFIIPT